MGDYLKLIAMITMLIDHVGAYFFPELIFLRIIGRLSFPIFCYFIVQGYTRTSNLFKYVKRLMIFFIISQIPYFLLSNKLNVLFTFLISIFVIYIYDLLKSKFSNYYDFAIIFIFMIVYIFSFFIPFDYGFYGVLLIFILYRFKEFKLKRNIFILILTIMYSLVFNSHIQLFSLISLFLIDVNIENANFRLNRYFSYVFYPLHLVLIVLLKI